MTGLPPDFHRQFEKARNVERTSDPNDGYNCFAYAAGDETRNWDPFGEYWPPSAPRERSYPAVVKAFATLGYEPGTNGNLVAGMDKVAIYVKVLGSNVPAQVTHAARQLPSGRWTSKLGRNIDVEHDLGDLYGSEYGHFAYFLERARPTEPDAG